MKKEIRTVTGTTLQITTVDERWYARPATDSTTGLPTYQYVPSVTWISGFYPKGIAFYKWLAGKGWDEAEAIKNAAGDKGSKVHQAMLELLDGKTISMGASYVGGAATPEELTLEEYTCVMSFVAWWTDTIKETGFAPRVVDREFVVWNDVDGYAGTIDLLCELYNPKTKSWELWIVDFKTGQYVWPDMECQLSGYKAALVLGPATARLAILQLGYKANRRGWKWTEVEDQYDLFLAAKRIWAKETDGEHPKQRDYPLSLQLPTPAPTLPDPAPVEAVLAQVAAAKKRTTTRRAPA